MKFECPHCTQYIACDEKHAGELIFCPKCQGEMIIPDAPEPAAPPGPQAALKCPYCSADVVLPLDDLDNMVGKVLRCSACRKRIDVAAEEPAPVAEPQPEPEPEPEARPRPVVKVKKKVVRIRREAAK